MGTIQCNDKTTHRQHVKTGSYGNGKTEVQDFSRTNPGLFIFQGLNFFPILYNTTFKSPLFSARSGEMKRRTRFL